MIGEDGEKEKRETKGERMRNIFIEGDKAWCLIPQGAQRLIFLFNLSS